MSRPLGCTRRYYIVCIHVVNNSAAPRVYPHNDADGCDGEILCATCDVTSQQVGGWARLLPVLRAVCSHCCRVWLRAAAESEVLH
jgi:hypothetical protein